MVATYEGGSMELNFLRGGLIRGDDFVQFGADFVEGGGIDQID